MINKITIRNFQSHINTQLDLVPGVNVIVGNTDSGKSSIIRAIQWAVFNRPSGDSFISNNGRGKTSVVLDTSDGVVCRVKSKQNNENLYIVKGVKFNSVGLDVPEEVKKVLGLGEINFSNQLDPPFFLSLSSGEAARYVNEVVDLSTIDKLFSSLNKKIRACSADINLAETERRELESRLSELEYAKELEEELKKAEKLYEQQKEIEGDIEYLESLLDDLASCEEERNKLKKYELLNPQLEKIDTLSHQYAKMEGEFNDLLGLLNDLIKKTETVQRHNKDISNIESELNKLMKGAVCPLCGNKIR